MKIVLSSVMLCLPAVCSAKLHAAAHDSEQLRKRSLIAGEIIGFKLYTAADSAANNGFLGDLEGGDVINMQTLGVTDSADLNVVATTSGDVESVRFGLDSNDNFNTESGAPYALCGGNSNGDYVQCTGAGLDVGTHTVKATPFSADYAQGTAFETASVTFTVVSATSPSSDAIQLNLMVGDVVKVADLTTGYVVNGVSDPTDFNIDAIVSSEYTNIQMVRFGLDGDDNFSEEKTAKYAMCGNQGDVFNPCPKLTLGTHTVTASVFVNGTSSTSTSVTFTLVDNAPTNSPPTTEEICGLPEFVGSWERYNDYPLHVAESAGGFIGNDGNDLLIVSGFHDDWGKATDKVYALDTTQTPFEWERMDDLPMDDVEIPWSKSKTGISHTAFVIVKDVYYMCGGYVGGNPGPETNACFKYNHSIRPGNGEQWSRLPNLPKGRAGGGLVYDSGKNALYFSAGAIRPRANDRHAEDQDETWMLPLDDVEDPNKEAKWNELAPAELTSNHIGFVSAKDGTGNERYFFYGGQDGEDEPDGNYDDMYEYLPSSNTWEARKSMPFGRGHTSASTRPIGCGFIIAGGAINGGWVKTSDVTFYDIDEDEWTKIGELPDKINTPVCDINGEWLYCQSGHISKEFSYRRKIKVEGGSQ